MLQFFKKSGSREKPRSSPSSPATSPTLERPLGGDGNPSRAHPVPSHSLEEEEEDDEESVSSLKLEICTSRLSKTLAEILNDKDALGYFLQFMESRNRLAVIKCWMEVECFRGTEDNYDGFNSNNQGDNVNKNDVEAPKNRFRAWRTIDEESGGSGVVQDALRVYNKYIVKDTLRINVDSGLKSQMEEAVGSSDHPGLIKGLLEVQKTIFRVLKDEFIDDFLRSEFHCKHQIDVLTSGDVKLADILFNETAFFYFMEFMELENKRELLDFWMSAVSYKQNLVGKGYYDPMEAQSDALIIYEKYFSLQATMPLGFSDKIRFQVEQNICTEGGDGPHPDCFEKPSIIVYNFLSKHYLPAFLSSQLYYKYLSELISTIQSSACGHPRVKRAGSDCSSEVSTLSIGTHDTSQNSHSDEINQHSNRQKMNGSMSIDARQLYDPDSLWRRTKCNLSVGYVDSLGRFVTEIDPDPQRKYESRLSRAVKRFIHLEQDKAKEELAWKIAEMIVREITSLTLGVQELRS
ncbi:A-kinase anchor protein 10, mitochondrial isoform X1 [Diachasma alloeum]|uniref:A-kinase anchor protein 10, mitochondrial isoform X1 n=2 Tax=Diachasma alloeum TaxID=454923 RepID=UPI0007382155|nr:A-kinase anchor protein 10, mitochondrial isoform X1 [Diachasma alloeum]